jgi:hypothetical protein
MTVRRIGVLSAAKMLCALYAALGLVFGGIMSAVALLTGLLGSGGERGMGAVGGLLFGAGAVVVLPIFYGLLGLVGGAIGAGLYNLAAGVIGGLELEVEGRG